MHIQIILKIIFTLSLTLVLPMFPHPPFELSLKFTKVRIILQIKLLFDYYLQKINSNNDYWILNQRPNLRIKQKKKLSIHFIFPYCNQVKRAKWSTSLIYLSSKQQTNNTCSTQIFCCLPKKQVQLDHPPPPHPLETFCFHNTQP